MAVEAKIRWKADMDVQKVINGYNKIAAKQQKQIDKLKETVAISKKAERAGRRATRAAPNFIKSIQGLASMAAGISLVNRGLRQGVELEREALDLLVQQKGARTELAQLASGKDKPLDFPKQLVNAARELSQRNAITLVEGQNLAFALKSRVPDATPQQIAAFKSVEFLVDKVQGVSLAADAQRQFPNLPQGLKGIRKVLGGLLVGAERSKLTVNQLAPVLAKPSQSAQELGFDFAEVVAAAAAGAAGVAEATEQATQARALFSDTLRAKSPGARRLKRIARKGGLSAFLEAIDQLSEKQKLRTFSNKRSFQAALFLSKPAQRELIEQNITAVRRGVEFAGEGGNDDVLQKEQRLLDADSRRQIIRTKQITANRKEIARQASNAPARQVIRDLVAVEVEAISLQAEGIGIGGKLHRFGFSLEQGIFGFLGASPATILQKGIEQVQSLEFTAGKDNRRRLVPAETIDSAVARLEDAIFLLNDPNAAKLEAAADKLDRAADKMLDAAGRAIP